MLLCTRPECHLHGKSVLHSLLVQHTFVQLQKLVGSVRFQNVLLKRFQTCIIVTVDDNDH